MEGRESIEIRVHAVTRETDTIRSLELRRPAGEDLPAFTAGAHVDLHLSNRLTRSYSLINSQDERYRYMISVSKDPTSRGGSVFIHDVLQVGDRLQMEPPRNNFPLVEDVPHSIFIAGGIGITPFLSMIARANQLGRSWELHYGARSRASAAFLDRLMELAGTKNRLCCHFDDESGGKFIDLVALVAASGPAAHLYCCGPAAMLAAFEDACRALAPERVHVEYFTARAAPSVSGGFTVLLKRQNRSVTVPPGSTILDAVLAAGLNVPFSCREGVCGTCETRVLDGIPDHRDAVLSPAERLANRTMMICCSGSLT